MKLYDETIQKFQALLGTGQERSLPLGETDWKDVSDRSMILRSEMAYELGGEGFPATGCTVVTADSDLVPEDKITLLGPDLPQIDRDVPYARIAFVRVTEEALGEGQALYQAIRNLEYTRYHFYPEGFMMRVSASGQKESVRVGREALKRGLDFTKTGNRMITAFRRRISVEAVQIFYVTAKEADYPALRQYAAEAERITKTIDHIMKTAVMDCGACSLQKVCDEVEGLKALHFRERRGSSVG
ncbi:MAG: carbon monoxide dehydrogenase [Roseburia sp.]|nr:carbon monoxide dehydrogenase [Roseburia sp.]MCM1098719.1 carbon monoxide dehydrogenase [Ruminococcus flavefaciens]